MTVEPKFIPSTSLQIAVNEDMKINVRLVDCVGSVIPSALGYETEEGPRLVKTPWFEESIAFEEAARIGTEKVIYNHANLGVYVTSDGSFGDFKRYEYQQVEEKLIPQIEGLATPYVIVLNVKDPKDKNSLKVKAELEEKYKVAVVIVNVLQMTVEDCDLILSEALKEFPIEELDLLLPDYLQVLGDDVSVKNEIGELLEKTRVEYKKIKDIKLMVDSLKDSGLFSNVEMTIFSPEEAKASIVLELSEDKYENIVNELLGTVSTDKVSFLSYLYKCRKAVDVYDEIAEALNECKETGYGISIPKPNEMKLLPPTVIKQNGKYGVKLQAMAPCIHLIKVEVESTFTPMVGSAEQSQMLIENLVNDEEKQEQVWNQEFFGRKLSDIVNDTMKNKVASIPDKSKEKLQTIMDKVVNSNTNGFIAVIL